MEIIVQIWKQPLKSGKHKGLCPALDITITEEDVVELAIKKSEIVDVYSAELLYIKP